MQLACLPRWFGLFLVVVHKVANSDLGLGMVELELEFEFELVAIEDSGTVEAEDLSGGLFDHGLDFPSN